MNNKLCIIISSEYATTVTDSTLWNDEVQADLNIVKATLQDHELVEIEIPAGAGLLTVNKLVKHSLDNNHTYYPTCHIVLNTHGVPGKCDLKHEITQMIVLELSRRNTIITQISALLCDGMTRQTMEQAQEAHRMNLFSHNIIPKAASMSVLQQRLSAMVTHIAQDFKIRGFTYAYVPENAQDEVIGILKGHGGRTYTVSTQSYIAPNPDQYIEELTSSMQLVIEYRNSSAKPDDNYGRATNVLGAALTSMKDNVLAHIKNGHPLASENQPLLDAVENYVVQQNMSPDAAKQSLNVQNFNSIYKRWLKDKKVYSEERMVVLENHLSLYLSLCRDNKDEPRSLSA
jgi:hypothetical protein